MIDSGERVRVGRFVIPSGDDPVLAHFVDRHFVAHSARERLRVLAARTMAGAGHVAGARRLLVGSDPPALDDPVITHQVGRALHRVGLDPDGRWMQLLDYPGGRFGSVIFAFPPAGREPSVVVKIRPSSGPAPSLRRECQALSDVRSRLPPKLRATTPEPLNYGVEGGIEFLAVTVVPGRPAYLDMRNLLHPGRQAAQHMDAASLWLAGFHEATTESHGSLEPEAELPDPGDLRERIRRSGIPGALAGDPELAWYARLRDSLARQPIPRSAVHGDFWARNLLMGEGPLPGVVDWEHYHPWGAPTLDLFHFPLTYGLNHPWVRYRRRPPLEAFCRTFLQRNRVSRAVRSYLEAYARRRGMDLELIRLLFLLHLLTRASGDPHQGTTSNGPVSEADGWITAYALVLRADDSVVSAS